MGGQSTFREHLSRSSALGAIRPTFLQSLISADSFQAMKEHTIHKIHSRIDNAVSVPSVTVIQRKSEVIDIFTARPSCSGYKVIALLKTKHGDNERRKRRQ